MAVSLSKQSLGDGQAGVITLSSSVAGPGRIVWLTAMRSPPVLAPLRKMMHQSPVWETNRFYQGPKGEWGLQQLGQKVGVSFFPFSSVIFLLPHIE